MNQLLAMLPDMGLVLLAFFAGPGAAVALLLLQRRQRAAQHRIPFDRRLLRSAGYTVRQQMDEARYDLGWSLMSLAAFPLLVLAIYLAQTRTYTPQSSIWFVYVGLAAAFVVWEVAKILRTSKRLIALRTGYDAELAAGQELDHLMLAGAHVFHDVPGDSFNIDHVVVSEKGLFAIETKGVSKSAHLKGRPGSTVRYDGTRLVFPTWTTTDPLDQAQRQAQWLAKWCSSAVGDTVDAEPVVAIPGWFIERSAKAGIRVLAAGELRHLLSARDRTPAPLPSSLVQRIVHQIDQRCRDVNPSAMPPS